MKNSYDLGYTVEMIKNHPCGCNKFKIIRVGVDIKIRCEQCGRTIMIPRVDLNKKIKKVLEVQND